MTVVDAKITHLAYAPEIAQVMLRRQQAEAIISARKKIVQGAVSMVEEALQGLSERDIVVLDEPLPDARQLDKIIAGVFKAADLKPPAAEIMLRAVEAIQGLPAFSAEQITAMSLRKDGLDLDALWESKRRQIEQTPGLTLS